MTFMLSMGRTYGGFYFANGYTKRLCLGWVAFTFIPGDDTWIGDVLGDKEYEGVKRRVARAHERHTPGMPLDLPD